LKVRSQALSLSAPITRVAEALVRTGISTASYEIQFISALQQKLDDVTNKINDIKAVSRMNSKNQAIVSLRSIEKTSGTLGKIGRELRKVVDTLYLASDVNLASWIQMDFNFTLAQRDRLTAKLVDYMKFAANGLRRSPLESADLFPDVEEVIGSADKELSTQSAQTLREFMLAQTKRDKYKPSTNKFQNKSFKPRKQGQWKKKKGNFRGYSNYNKDDGNSKSSNFKGGRGGKARSNYKGNSHASDKSK